MCDVVNEWVCDFQREGMSVQKSEVSVLQFRMHCTAMIWVLRT